VEETRSELWAGIVIIIAGVLIISMVMTVGNYADFYLKPRTQVVVYLSKVHGIKVNDPVHYAGMNVGQVVGVEYDQEKGKVKLTLSIFADKTLREDTSASVAVSMMGIAAVEISPGSGKPITTEGAEGPIEVTGKPTSTLQDVADKAGALIDNLREAFGEEQRKQFQEIIANIRDASADIKELIGRINTIVEENRADLRDTVKHAKKTMSNMDQITTENRDGIAKTVRNVQKASERLDALFNQLDAALKDVQVAIGDAKKFMGKANLILDENRGKISDALRNVKDVTANLQIMSQDLRRHPWKLLNKPTEKEIVTSDIASAADQSALLQKNLDNSLEQLLQLLERDPKNPQVKEMIAALKETLEILRQNQVDVRKMLREQRKAPDTKK